MSQQINIPLSWRMDIDPCRPREQNARGAYLPDSRSRSAVPNGHLGQRSQEVCIKAREELRHLKACTA